MTVDPKVHDLAQSFVDDFLDEIPADIRVHADREQLVQRAAAAMQRAIEDEIDALRREVQP
jgi:hypothetical protein